MNANTVAVQSYSTITAEASGSGNETVVVPIIKSNVPFTDVTIVVRPLESPSPYSVSVYMDGEIVETHTFPSVTGKMVAHLSYPDSNFPANIGTNAIPKYHGADKSAPAGLSFYVSVSNMDSAQRVFEVYAVYQAFELCRFAKVTDTV